MMFLCGFVPGYVCSLFFRIFGLLRVDDASQIAGLDPVKVPLIAYPEGMTSAQAAE